MICAKNQEIGSDHLSIVAEFTFTPVEDDSDEDESARSENSTHIFLIQ
jgi:hypothetical protein